MNISSIEGIMVRKESDGNSIGMIELKNSNQWGNYIELPLLIFDKLKDMNPAGELPNSGTYIKITVECNKTLSTIEVQDNIK